MKYFTTAAIRTPPEPIGYRNKHSGAVYWKSKTLGYVYVFYPSDGGCGREGSFEHMAKEPATFEPIYGSVTITITDEE